ncbi:ligase [Knoellia sinensis KCTC 19936]|uniref:Ligase n=1 Tax=Knoellia sinensis KCTC 19936 TaxID=1385520 RepID=A0A0A0J0F3_9MICO|nr:5-formyltetrahydrofolate cyclo-ligase [Knoellia sinensis]KGN30219.1 ligase [Knoellia sinensis KCTC 19936]
MDETAARSTKTSLRSDLLAARREIVAGRDRLADDRALADHVLDVVRTRGLGEGDTIAAFEAMRSEPPTIATIEALVRHGIRVLVPITLPDNDLDWCDAKDDRRMPLGPAAISAAVLVLAPGLAVDSSGTRLGRGGGSYDRALPRRRPDAPVLVVLHPGEIHPTALPADDHDEPVDGVLTADGITWL